MATKNILFLHKGGFCNRGSEKVLLCLLNGLDREQCNPLLVCNHKLLADEAEKNGIRTLLKDWLEVMIEDSRRFVMDNLSQTKQIDEFNNTLLNMESAHA